MRKLCLREYKYVIHRSERHFSNVDPMTGGEFILIFPPLCFTKNALLPFLVNTKADLVPMTQGKCMAIKSRL
jgi:hypothetical protein